MCQIATTATTSPLARILRIAPLLPQVESYFSIGAEIRVQVRRLSVVIETTAPVANSGGSQFLAFATVLQNGDVVCVQASDDGFVTWHEACRTIPTPQFSYEQFTTNIKFDECPVLAPNCTGSDNITLNITVTDANGANGTLIVTGTLNSINALDDVVNIPIDGIDGSFSYTTAFGLVFLTATYDVGYDATKNQDLTISVTDCVSWQSVEDWCGFMSALLTDDGLYYLTDEAGNALTQY